MFFKIKMKEKESDNIFVSENENIKNSNGDGHGKKHNKYLLDSVSIDASDTDGERLHDLCMSGIMDIENPVITLKEMAEAGVYDEQDEGMLKSKVDIAHKLSDIMGGSTVEKKDVFRMLEAAVFLYIKKCEQYENLHNEMSRLVAEMKKETEKISSLSNGMSETMASNYFHGYMTGYAHEM